ncbi:hypothetical protein [Methanococcus aeolicus]|uniref:DNA primase large subunit PriL n=1 Tax=Methanococcus aeolicus (strain ATCC BAA-1280 / DSM 17508 / OCM 812 / Nankai-3) TaxID=419665 RepID=A6UW72_META3|nr:hypothetical protein [Methanococcus aeolicus]ABR56744.1 DNA primase, large subunit [Methanococcus aeolicus Nankai-3]UXM84744.1 hypothetical protein N6C89_00130 [Methanococcus aeolicus]
MFWENLHKIKDFDFFEEITNKDNLKLIKALFGHIFDIEGYDTYYNDLKIREQIGIDIIAKETLINYLALIIISNTKYHNLYIKKYSDKKYNKIKDKLPDEISIWEFIEVASTSRNNDLHLERVNLEQGQVNLTKIKRIYAIELTRLKLKEMIEKIKKVELPEEILNNENIKELFKFLDENIKFEGVEGIKISNFEGNILKEWHPPCIRGILDDILSGGSPSHYARRSFVTYWFVAKFDQNLRPIMDGGIANVRALDIASEDEIERFLNEIVAMYNTVGDFDEGKTKYYISHNIGYRVANHITHCEYCKNWRDDGGKGLGYYCKPDEICNLKNVIHPLDYLCHKIKEYQKNKENKENKENNDKNNKDIEQKNKI